MAELKVYLSEELDKRFRVLAMSIFGYGRGSLSEAAVEALSSWCKKHESQNGDSHMVQAARPELDPVALAEERPGSMSPAKEKDTPSSLQTKTNETNPSDRNDKTEPQTAQPRTRKLVKSKPGKRRIENLVAGILLDKGRFLVEKRRLDKEADPGYIEIPGGHVERGETLDEALRREMKEELGIRVESARIVGKALATATNGERGRIHYFHIEKWRGRIQSHEAERVYWESEISKLSIIPDRKAIRNLLRTRG